jgi:import inner membrane translocase subunit TIM44
MWCLIWRARRGAQGKFADARLLDISDVELHDLQMFEEDPVVVVKFSCQQINCFRDKFGNVVEGSPDDVHRVLYVWALRQARPPAVILLMCLGIPALMAHA